MVNTHAPQPTPADGSAVVARTDKKSIFTRALQGAVVLGAGLALTVGAAVSPQAAVAATYGDNLATTGANDWQIVSGKYQGNTDKSNGSDVPADQVRSDDYVRVQKSVVPTDKENEFKVYLSIDKRADAYSEIFNAKVTLENTNSAGSTLGGTALVNGNTPSPNPTGQEKDAFYYQIIIKNLDGTEIVGDVVKAGYFPNAYPKTAFLQPSVQYGDMGLVAWNTKDGMGTGSASNPAKFVVDMNSDGYEEIFGSESVSVVLDSVADSMGDHIVFGDVVAGDFATKPVCTNGVLNWTPFEKTDANDDDGDGWIENVAELVYTITLDVTDKGFVSCGLDGSGDPAGSNSCHVPTNGSATLNYTVTTTTTTGGGSTSDPVPGSIEFKSPVVKGLLYDLKLQKVDEDGEPLTGAKFKLMSADGTKVVRDEAEVDGNGYLEFYGLPHGNYVLVETQKPEGYDFSDDSPNGETPVTLCYTSGAYGGSCCQGAISDYAACTTNGHANNAANESAIQIENTRNEVQFQIPVYKMIYGRSWENDDSFTFTIEPQYGAPSPKCGDKVQTEVTIQSEDTVQASDNAYAGRLEEVLEMAQTSLAVVRGKETCPITFTESGNYIYKLTEQKPVDSDLIYDQRTLYVGLSVDVDGKYPNAQLVGVTEYDPWAKEGVRSGADGPQTREAIVAIPPLFINRYIELDVPSLLNETKTVNGHDAAAKEFTFTVEAKSHGQEGEEGYTSADEAAALAGFDSSKLTFDNNLAIAVNQLSEIRTANALHFTAKNVGKTYEYWYAEEPDETGAWHQVDEDGNPAAVVYKVEVSVDWVNADKTELKATLSLYKSTDNGLNWGSSPLDTVTVTSGEEIGEDDKLTVSFINEYGSTLKIVKTDQDGNPLPGAEFTVMGTNPQYSETATTDLNDDGSEAVAAFENIPDGTYTITETVPTGYQKINDMTLEINDDTATLTWKGTDQEAYDGTITKDKNGVFTIKIANYVNPDLPSTGSSGTVLMGGLGTAAIVLAGAWLLKQRGIDFSKFTSR